MAWETNTMGNPSSLDRLGFPIVLVYRSVSKFIAWVGWIVANSDRPDGMIPEKNNLQHHKQTKIATISECF